MRPSERAAVRGDAEVEEERSQRALLIFKDSAQDAAAAEAPGAHEAQRAAHMERANAPDSAVLRDAEEAVALGAKGYTYQRAIVSGQNAQDALAEVNEAFAAGGVAYSRINSEREQVKLGREHGKLTPGVRHLVEQLEAKVRSMMGPEELGALMDVYALRTAAGEPAAGEARAPQAWHLDDWDKFPVAAVILRGKGATEFHDGRYADFASDGPDRDTLKAWTADWRQGTKRPCSQSTEEQRHWTERMRAADLLILSEDGLRCDWDRPAAVPAECGAGDGAIFWSNKVHRGPATAPGEERILVFVSWNRKWLGAGRKKISRNAASDTDYSYYVEHFEPKLAMSDRAKRRAKHARLQ